MKVVTTLSEVSAPGAVACIGNFDGVHLGHRALLSRMRELATAAGRPAVVVTFFPPARVLFSGASYLMSPTEKVSALAAYSPDAVVMTAFDREFAQTDKQAWLTELAALAPSAIVVGKDFRFGNARAGSVADLRTIASVEAFPLLEVAGQAVKSSHIRELLANGEVTAAAQLLGANYLVTGMVERGQERGRTIGFPTANVTTPPQKTLPLGVFSAQVEVAGRVVGGMANVGPRPTFPNDPPSLEVHLFDFSEDIYGQEIGVRFVAKLRSQQRFSGLAELKAQLRADEQAARATLGQR